MSGRGARFSIVVAVVAAMGCRAQPPLPTLDHVVVAIPAGPPTLRAHEVGEEFALTVLSNVYEPLVEVDAAMAVRPGLAESWYTPDETTWVFRVRQGVPMHDGRMLEARHVAASIERARLDPGSRRRWELGAIQNVDAPDARTLVIKTRRPFGPLPARLVNVYVSIPVEKEGEAEVGTGPYRIASWKPGGDTSLVAFPEHWEGAPSIPRAEFAVVPDAAERLRRLRAGLVHVLIDVPADVWKGLARDHAVRTVVARGMRVVFLGMDCTNPSTLQDGSPNPFRDVRVRRATALAIDRAHLVEGPLGGYGEIIDQTVAPEVFGYHNALPRRPFVPQEARRLLGEAGLGGGFAVSLDYMPGRYRAVDRVVEDVARDLASVGIRVAPRPRTAPAFFDGLYRRDMNFFLVSVLGNTGDAAWTYEWLFHTSQGLGTINAGLYSNPSMDRLIDEASALLRPEARAVFYRRAAALAFEDVPVIPLYRQTDLYAVAAGLTFEPRPDRRLRARDMRWGGPEKTLKLP